jgi:hypothetical protein
MKARLRLDNQSIIIHLLHLGRRTIRFVSETDLAIFTTIEGKKKSTSACCSATLSLLFRNPAVVSLAPVDPFRRTNVRRGDDGIARRSTTASTDWENAATGCVFPGEQKSHRIHDQSDVEDLGLLLIDESNSQ